MALKIAVLKETAEFERRVAASPETVKKLTSLGCDVIVQAGAGDSASFTDAAFTEAGAKIAKSAADTLKSADIVLCVQTPDIALAKKGALLVGLLAPYAGSAVAEKFAKAGLDAFSMELVPRITRAQSMDVLSSQSNLAGYKAVLDATEHFTRAFPMMMTAAGTVPPAKVFVMGAGVAGLQAIATARRLGAVVSATDVRPAAKEQVQSLGASFVAVEDEEFREAETAGGYAKEMSKTYQRKQQVLIEETIRKQDIVITTALIPGRPAPKLVTASMVTSMQPGSVIVDLAVETGGNCELSKAGEVVEVNGVKIIGHRNVPSRLSTNASALYAKNLLNLLQLIIDKDSGKLAVNWDDDIIKGVALTREGKVIHPNFSGAAAKPAPKKETASAAKETPQKTASSKGTPKKPAAKKPAAKTAAPKTTKPKAATAKPKTTKSKE